MAFYIDLNDLRRLGACKEERGLFCNRFGRRALVTVTNAVRHSDFDWFWLAHSAFTLENRNKFFTQHSVMYEEYCSGSTSLLKVSRFSRQVAQLAAEILLQQGFIAHKEGN
jgi:hypothetical protein